MIKSQWSVPKLTGSYADALVAVGLADLVNQIPAEGKARRTVIKDNGDHYDVSTVPGICTEEVLSMRAEPGYSYIRFKSVDTAPEGATAFDYEDAREVEKRYREYRASTKSSSHQAVKSRMAIAAIEGAGSEAPVEPPHDLQVIKSFNALRMGSDAYNNLNRALSDAPSFGQIVARHLGYTDYGPEPEERPFAKAVSSLQFFNPVAGKGINRAKPDGTSLGSIPNRMIDWFSEWMRFRAMALCLVSWMVDDDTKVMTLAPAEVDVKMLQILRMSLLEAKLWGSLMLDIRGAITVARELVSHSEELHSGKGRFSFSGNSPKQVVAGLSVGYFKSLGTASAVMNLSFIGIPGWFPIKDKSSAEDWLSLLDEHEKAIRSLDESHSDDVGVLIKYRDFLSGGDLSDALTFFADYDIGMMRKLGAGKYSVPFTTDNVRRLVMSYPSVSEIVVNPGFEAIAAAIRRSTIKAQIRKAKTGRVVFEVQYGLAQDWKRTAKHRDEFIKRLSDFVQRYNSETAKHAEQNKEMRPYIYTEHLSALIQLIKDDKSSELVGMLLLAYGYALEPKEDNEREDQ